MHTIMVKNNDDVVVFGRNYCGQLGLGHNIDQNIPILMMHGIPIRQIACGYEHTVILAKIIMYLLLVIIILGNLD